MIPKSGNGFSDEIMRKIKSAWSRKVGTGFRTRSCANKIRMIPKSGNRFSDKIIRNKKLLLAPQLFRLRIVDGKRRLHRRPRGESSMPGAKAPIALAPILFGKTEIEI